MSSLLAAVRRGTLTAPTSPKFERPVWEQIAAAPGSPDDAHLAALGLRIHAALVAMRPLLGFVNDNSDAFGKRQAILAVANHQGIVATAMGTEAANRQMPPSPVAVMDLLADVKLPLALGDFDADSIIESTIEGAGRLLRMLAGAPSDSQTTLPNAAFSAVSNDLNVGIGYLTLEALWLDIVWNGYRLEPPNRFVPHNLARATSQAISDHRHAMTAIQQDALTYLRTRTALTGCDPMRRLGLHALVVDGRVELQVGPASMDALAKDEVLRGATLPPFYRDAIESSSAAFPSLTLALVSRTYAHLTSLADGAFDHGTALLATLRIDPSCQVGIADFAPAISRKSLSDALAQILDVPTETGEELIRFFVGAGVGVANGIDHWAAPLVSLDETSVGVFSAATRHASLRRLPDLWLRRLGFDLEFRGDRFEVEVRRALAETAATSALSALTNVMTSDFKLSPEADGREQIDLLIVLGDHVLVGEVKCFLQPSNQLDRHNHQKKLIDAARQVGRKADAVLRHKADFRSRAVRCGLKLPDAFEVVPFVVLNHALGVGQLIENIPIADLRTLQAFFEGGLQRNAVITSEGEIESADIEVFWNSPEEAPSRIRTYLAHPPQVCHLRNAVEPIVDTIVFPGLISGTATKLRLEVRAARIDSRLL